MPALIPTIINGFIFIFSFFRKIFPFLNSFAIWWNMNTGIRILKFLSLKAVVILIISLSVASFTLFMTALVKVYNAIHNMLDIVSQSSSASSSPVLSNFFYFLSVSGILDGFMSFLPLIFSAVTFFLAVVLYKVTIRVQQAIVDSVWKLV